MKTGVNMPLPGAPAGVADGSGRGRLFWLDAAKGVAIVLVALAI
jgi:uncharacterized membrane protein YcfT